MNFAQQTVVIILSGGGAVAIYTLVKALIAFRGSADSREATAIGNLEKWRLDADERADAAYAELAYERRLSAFWQRRAAQLERVALIHGVDVEPCPPPPPRPSRLDNGDSVTIK